jgi:hypothetical protein
LQAVASTTIEAGTILIPAEGGKGTTLPQATANDQICTMRGIAQTSAAASQIIEFISRMPQQHVVKSSSKLTQRII